MFLLRSGGITSVSHQSLLSSTEEAILHPGYLSQYTYSLAAARKLLNKVELPFGILLNHEYSLGSTQLTGVDKLLYEIVQSIANEKNKENRNHRSHHAESSSSSSSSASASSSSSSPNLTEQQPVSGCELVLFPVLTHFTEYQNYGEDEPSPVVQTTYVYPITENFIQYAFRGKKRNASNGTTRIATMS